MMGYPFNNRLKFFAGSKNQDEDIHVLLVSPSQRYLEHVQHCISTIKESQASERCYKLKVHITKHICDVLRLYADLMVDYIIFIVDVTNINCIQEVESNIDILDLTFGRERICLLNPQANYSCNTSPKDLFQFAQRHQFNIVNEKINLEATEETNEFAEDLLNLIELSCGVVNGIPLIGLV